MWLRRQRLDAVRLAQPLRRRSGYRPTLTPVRHGCASETPRDHELDLTHDLTYRTARTLPHRILTLPDDVPWPRAGRSSIRVNLQSVHPYTGDADGREVRLARRRAVGHHRGIEQHQIGEHARRNAPAVVDAHVRRG